MIGSNKHSSCTTMDSNSSTLMVSAADLMASQDSLLNKKVCLLSNNNARLFSGDETNSA